MSTVTLTADEYEELVRACEKAEAMVEELKDCLRLSREAVGNQQHRATVAEIDCDRYRAALEQIIDLNAGSFPLPWDTQNIARAALNPVENQKRDAN